MRRHLTVATLLLLSITFAPAAAGQTCSCNAPDSSCTVSVTCQRGCTTVCASQDACYAACGNPEADLFKVRVTITAEKANGKQVAAKLTSQTRKKVEFQPNSAGELVSFDLKNAPLWDALEFLAKHGKVTVGGIEFKKLRTIRDLLLNGGKVSVNFGDISVKDVLAKLSSLTGLRFRVTSGKARSLVSISVKEVTLNEFIAQVESQTGVKITPMGTRIARK
ncbi:MAG: hypothetical protein LC803_22030 [Acidobacteria bacterium]|nr:hypothetical protein [Acidobacteriota bacterium]